jgi:acetyl-CoA carboxylase/biotin carboxylase 1
VIADCLITIFRWCIIHLSIIHLFYRHLQIAVHFADLHDTPGRMKAKGVIRSQVHWGQSRTFFYWRLKRKLKEFEVVDAINGGGTKLAFGQRKSLIAELQQWFLSLYPSCCWETDDRLVVSWLDSHVTELKSYISEAKVRSHVSAIGARLSDLLRSADAEGTGMSRVAVLQHALMQLPQTDRDDIKAALK